MVTVVLASGRPIVYTSADSVFQIACHEDVVPVPELYRWCEIAREILHGFEPEWALGLCAATVAWFLIAVYVFRRGLMRYTSASS